MTENDAAPPETSRPPRLVPAGDRTVVVELGGSIDPETNARVHALVRAIEMEPPPGVVDLVPAYASVLVQYDPMQVSLQELSERLDEAALRTAASGPTAAPVVEIPVLYGGEYGPDLDFVAERAGLPEDGVIAMHCEADYPVYMMGFTPGFPYLGGLPERLFTPRLETPRTAIPAGSVGIAESQTGVYPVESPGGWRIVGRTPLRLFDARREPPSLVSAGDRVRFVPLDGEAEFERLAAAAAAAAAGPEDAAER